MNAIDQVAKYRMDFVGCSHFPIKMCQPYGHDLDRANNYNYFE